MPTVVLSGSGTWTCPEDVTEVRLLLVGGGGGGGSNQGGGGGGGGIVFEPNFTTVPLQDYAYSVGFGGNGGPNSSRGNGATGGTTTFAGAPSAAGGGRGSGTNGTVGGNGGCGGGGDGVSDTNGGTGSQGNDGADGAVGGNPGGGGGGGSGGIKDAGNVGLSINFFDNNIGGIGWDSSPFFGPGLGDGGYFASGGNGQVEEFKHPGGGGYGGANPFGDSLKTATPGTGGGGGAGSNGSRSGGTGGSGTIIIQWGPIPEAPTVFTEDGNFVANENMEVDYLIVGGGGGSAGNFGGGGGGGAVIAGSTTLSPGTYPVVVGQGGIGHDQGTGLPADGFGTNGGASSFLGFTAEGGGAGTTASQTNVGRDGGTGGGNGWQGPPAGGIGSQGGNGGGAFQSGITNNNAGGGGGGAGGDGENGNNQNAGDGGPGIASTITGPSVTYGGGGGAGGYSPFSMSPGAGGTGGGGAGTNVVNGSGEDGVDGLGGGGGGGGGGGAGGKGGDGGNGTVIILVTARLGGGGGEGGDGGFTLIPGAPIPPPDPPTVVVDLPATDTVTGGDQVVLSPVFESEVALTYQWYRNGQLTGVTTREWSFQATSGLDQATYYCVAINAGGSVQTAILTLTVTAPAFAFVNDLPATLSVPQYSDAILTVSTTQAPEGVTYQWTEIGVGVLDIQGATLLLQKVTVADSARQFQVDATDAYGTTITSTTATINVFGTAVDDATLGGQSAPAPGRETPTKRKAQDWASLVAAAEGEIVYVEDYEFSGRTFVRPDILRNPR